MIIKYMVICYLLSVMTTKIISIYEGVNDFSLGEFNEYGFRIDSVKFETDREDYDLRLVKYSRRSDWTYTQTLQLTNTFGTNSLITIFTQTRDGLTALKIDSNCDGIFIIINFPIYYINNG